jgi:hypothetical protein
MIIFLSHSTLCSWNSAHKCQCTVLKYLNVVVSLYSRIMIYKHAAMHYSALQNIRVKYEYNAYATCLKSTIMLHVIPTHCCVIRRGRNIHNLLKWRSHFIFRRSRWIYKHYVICTNCTNTGLHQMRDDRENPTTFSHFRDFERNKFKNLSLLVSSCLSASNSARITGPIVIKLGMVDWTYIKFDLVILSLV